MSSNIVTNKLLHSAAKTRNFGRFASSSRGSEARLDLNPAADNFAATPELWRAVGLMLKNSDKFGPYGRIIALAGVAFFIAGGATGVSLCLLSRSRR